MDKLRETFVVYKDKQNKFYEMKEADKELTEVKLAVKKPNHKQNSEADIVYAKQMNKLLQEGILPSAKLEETIRNNGVWDDHKAQKEQELMKIMQDVNEKLRKGKMKVSEGAVLAKEGIRARGEWMFLTMQKNDILNNAADALARNHRFNYLSAVCTVYEETDKAFFKDYDDFLLQDSLGNIVPTLAGRKLANLLYNMDSDFRKDWPEYKFLLKYKLVNDKLDFINKDGQVVDIDGNPIVTPEPVKTEEVEPEFYDDTPSSPLVENPH